MLRIIMIMCFLLLTLIAKAESIPNIQLDGLESVNLLPESRFFVDNTGEINFDGMPDSEKWQTFQREQLRIGLLKGKIWIHSTFQTSGLNSLDALLEFDRQIDFIDIEIYRNGDHQNSKKTSTFTKFPIDFPNSNKNIIPLKLEPNSQYQLLISIYGHNGITGAIKLWEKNSYQKTDQIMLFFLIAYAVSVIIISTYNFSAFFATQYKAFIYHAAYGFSVLALQTSQYSYLDFLMGANTFRQREIIILLSINCAFTAVYLFINTIIETHKNSIFIKTNNLIVIFSAIIMTLSLIISYQTSLLLSIANITLAIIIGIFQLMTFIRKRDPQVLKLAILIILFAPSTTLLTLSRLGTIDNTFFTEYMILITIVLEMVVISGLLFGHIRSMQQLFWRSQFLDPSNKLPNILSLQKKIELAQHHNLDFSLTYIWVSGLEKIEISRGSEFRDKYLKLLSEHIQSQLENSIFKHDFPHENKQDFHVFYCEKNTLGILANLLDEHTQKHLQTLLNYSLGKLSYTYGYNLEVSLVIASTNALSGYDNVEKILLQTHVTLSQCIQNNHAAMLYSEEVGYNELRQITLLNEFEDALGQGQFYLDWQPQMSTSPETLAGLEALIRWKHPEYGLVSPDQFIPLLEQSTKITLLSIWVIREAIAKAPLFLDRFPNIDLSVNLSVYDLMGSHLIKAIDEILEEAPNNIAQHLTLEITESVHMEDNATVLKTVKQLQKRGFRISIDDFGAGYASFGYLQVLPANELKVDRRYAQSIGEPNSQAIIQSIFDLATRLNMTIVVEGIETKLQQDLVTQWGAHRLQGWHLGRPTSQAKILELPTPKVQPKVEHTAIVTVQLGSQKPPKSLDTLVQ